MSDELDAYYQAAQQEFELKRGKPEKIFEDVNEEAAKQIVKIATSSVSEHLRFKAAQYILDVTVFKTRDNEDELTKVLNQMKGATAE
jgi:hypothetical protein